MSHATVHSCTLAGVQALPVIVEVHMAGGLPGMSIVGLPQSAVRESKDRVKAAIQHIGLVFPQVKIIVNLAPADLPKRGGRFDLPIALGILQASGQLPDYAVQGLMVLGELGLTGQLRAVSGVLPTAHAHASGPRALYIPRANVAEALRCRHAIVYAADDLLQAFEQLRRRHVLPLVAEQTLPGHSGRQASQASLIGQTAPGPDMAEVIGQHKARRALEIAAAGAHNLLMAGPPGTGKSMLASRLPSIQPPMSEEQAMESACVASISYAGFDADRWGQRPFRAPHHTASGVALVGGGAQPMPGEVSLAHHGVLFLDELPEFSRAVLDVLREPMETGSITVSRAARQAEFPARFQLVAAMNPCPCGYHTDPSIRCRCTPDLIQRYQSRVSGPFMDRIDLQVDMQREWQQVQDGDSSNAAESSAVIRRRVLRACERQQRRQNMANARLSPQALSRYATIGKPAQALMRQASSRLRLSLRAQHRLLRVARTIADLEGSDDVLEGHLAQSLSYRRTPLLDTF